MPTQGMAKAGVFEFEISETIQGETAIQKVWCSCLSLLFEHHEQAQVAPVVPGVNERPEGLESEKTKEGRLNSDAVTEQTEEEEPFKGPEV